MKSNLSKTLVNQSKTLVYRVLTVMRQVKFFANIVHAQYRKLFHTVEFRNRFITRTTRSDFDWNPSDARARVGDETVSEFTRRPSFERKYIYIYSYSPRGHRRVLLFYFTFLIFFFYLYRIFTGICMYVYVLLFRVHISCPCDCGS